MASWARRALEALNAENPALGYGTNGPWEKRLAEVLEANGGFVAGSAIDALVPARSHVRRIVQGANPALPQQPQSWERNLQGTGAREQGRILCNDRDGYVVEAIDEDTGAFIREIKRGTFTNFTDRLDEHPRQGEVFRIRQP